MTDPNQYTIKRDTCGLPVNFKMKEESKPYELSIKSESDLERNFEFRNPKSITLSNIPERSCHRVRTDKTKMNTVEMKHIEGGWPDEVAHVKEADKLDREIKVWRRRLGAGEDFSNKVKLLIDKSNKIIKQNMRMDIYEDHLDEEMVEQIEDDFSAKTKSVFKDNCPYKRTVNQVTLYHEEDQTKNVKGVGRFAVTYKLCKGQDVSPTEKLPCYIWDINNPNEPLRTISCNSQILTAAFHPKNQDIIVCGCSNGTTIVFNLKEDKNIIVASSKIEESHREAVASISWIKTKQNNEFVTCSTDKEVIFWTIHNFDKIGQPVTKDSPPITITRETPCSLIDKETEKEYGATVIEYNSDSGPSKFLIATEQGTVFTINKKKDEGGEITQSKFGFKSGRHLGPIVAMQRCPDALKYFLSVGDWTARIWFEENTKTPILVSKFHSSYLTDGIWSRRPGIFFLSRNDGWIIAYDLTYKTNECCFMYKVSDSAITSLSISKEGDKLYIGDEEGKVSMVKLSKSFYNLTSAFFKNKAENLNKYFEREFNKEKGIDTVINLKLKKKVLKDDSVKIAKAEANLKERLRQIETDYMNFINNLQNHDSKEDTKSNNEENKDPSFHKQPSQQSKQIENTSQINADNLNASRNNNDSKDNIRNRSHSKIEEEEKEKEVDDVIEENKIDENIEIPTDNIHSSMREEVIKDDVENDLREKDKIEEELKDRSNIDEEIEK